ncbi:short-subunit dehydrogenase [Rhodococcus sp. 27YEA15]
MAVYNAGKFGADGLSASARVEFADSGIRVSTILPSAVRTGLSSGVPSGKGMPTVEPEVVAEAGVGTLRHRSAETAVPRYLAVWDLVDAVVPEWLINVGRRSVGDRRALTAVDPAERAEYTQRVARQAESGEHAPSR